MNLFEPELEAHRERLRNAGWTQHQRTKREGLDKEEWESPEKQLYNLGAAVAELDRRSIARTFPGTKTGAD